MSLTGSLWQASAPKHRNNSDNLSAAQLLIESTEEQKIEPG